MIRAILVTAVLLCGAPALAVGQQFVTAGTMHLSRAKCSWGVLSEIELLTDSIYVPIAQQMVEEGIMLAYGLLIHDYGDGWNVAWYTMAGDRQSMFVAREELTRRQEEQYPDLNFLAWFAERCHEHEDLIYTVGPHTRGPLR